MNPFKDEFKIIKEFIRSHIFLLSILFFLAFVCFGLYLPIYLVKHGYFQHVFWETGQLGDTIGGILSPFIAIGAAFLTFIAFWVQYQANQKQWEMIRNERLLSNFLTELTFYQNLSNRIASTYNPLDIKSELDANNFYRELYTVYIFYSAVFDNEFKLDSFPKNFFYSSVLLHINNCNIILSKTANSYSTFQTIKIDKNQADGLKTLVNNIEDNRKTLNILVDKMNLNYNRQNTSPNPPIKEDPIK